MSNATKYAEALSRVNHLCVGRAELPGRVGPRTLMRVGTQMRASLTRLRLSKIVSTTYLAHKGNHPFSTSLKEGSLSLHEAEGTPKH